MLLHSSSVSSSADRRFQRLAKGGDRVALADFQAMPELAGHPLVPRILQLADKDRDGYLQLADFTDAVGELGRLYTDDDRAACECPPAAHLAVHPACSTATPVRWQTARTHAASYGACTLPASVTAPLVRACLLLRTECKAAADSVLLAWAAYV